MPTISINQLTFAYPDQAENLFAGLTVNLDTSWKLALVGRNGRGKTTLLKIIAGCLGDLPAVRTSVACSYYPLTVRHPDDLAWNALQEGRNLTQWRVEKELGKLGLDASLLWQPFASLSGGERSKLLLAACFSEPDAFVLLDEPNNHLDLASRQQVAQYLREAKQGYIVVSHDRAFLNQVSDHVLALENQQVHLYRDDFAGYEQTKKDRDGFNQAKDRKLRREIKELDRSQKRLAAFANQAERGVRVKKGATAAEKAELRDKGFLSKRAAKVMKRSKNVARRKEDQLAEKQGLLANIEKTPALDLNFVPDYHQKLLEIEHLSLRIAGKDLFTDLSLQVKKQGVIALVGPNGSGKSILFKEILAKQPLVNRTGRLELASGLKISYLSQDSLNFAGSLPAFAKKMHLNYSALLNQLRKLGFARESFNLPWQELSQGQKKRVALAKSLVEEANLYLWDEPANYLDLFNQDQLVKLLQEQQPAMLLVDHDQALLQAVASQIVHLPEA